jgi:hypothetical protein
VGSGLWAVPVRTNFRLIIRKELNPVLTASEEEQRLLDLLTPKWWAEQSVTKGIRDTKLLKVDLTESGVTVGLELTGSSDIVELRKKIGSLRVLLQVEDETILDLLPGGRAHLVSVSVRTRYVTDDEDLLWHPGREGLGLDTLTGKPVSVPYHERLLLGGSSGSGKSWTMRPYVARTLTIPHIEIGWFVDGKVDEGNKWKGILPRIYSGPSGCVEAVEDGFDELTRRTLLMEQEGLSKWDTRLGPIKIFFVDEGFSIISSLKDEEKYRKEQRERGDPQERRLTVRLSELSTQGRSKGIVVVWCTQNPTRAGEQPGILPQVVANIDYRIGLRTQDEDNTKVIFAGRPAGLDTHLIPPGDRYRGYWYLNAHGPSLVRSWTISDEMIPLLAYPDLGRGRWPRDIALKTLRSHDGWWDAERLAAKTGCGTEQARKFLNSFSREGLGRMDQGRFELVR